MHSLINVLKCLHLEMFDFTSFIKGIEMLSYKILTMERLIMHGIVIILMMF
jgi:hypothetical protein